MEPELKKQKRREYYLKNQEKLKSQARAYYEANKEGLNQYSKAYREQNLEYFYDYNQKPETKKTMCIGRWKNRGIAHSNWDAMYKLYQETTHCQVCDIELCDGIKGANKRCLDHHHETGLVLGIVCHTCNVRDTLRKNYDKLISINTIND
jgi:hypothetical protein